MVIHGSKATIQLKILITLFVKSFFMSFSGNLESQLSEDSNS